MNINNNDNETLNYVRNNILNIILMSYEENEEYFNNIVDPLVNNSLNYNNNVENMIENIIENSLYDEPSYKNVVSCNGLKEVKSIIYNGENSKNNECPIILEKLIIGKEYSILPCDHVFDKESILKWLNNQSNKCPICRFELDYIEKKVNSNS